MTCSELNFLSSQAQYGLQIAKQAELPSLHAPVEEWDRAFDRIVFLANRLAVKQIALSKAQEERAQ
jgi:hypothetical protein